MAAAVRINDPIGHTPAMKGLLTGLLVGVLAGAAIAAVSIAVVGTGGLAAVAMVGAGAAMGAGLGEALSGLSMVNKEVTGHIAGACSGNVFTNGLAAARAHFDKVACDKHSGAAPIATGSETVYINGAPAARVEDKTGCGADLTQGSSNVFIGGGTVQTDDIHPEDLVPGWVHNTILVVGLGSAVVLAGPAIAVIGLAGGFGGGYAGSWAGGKLFGEGSDGQIASGILGSVIGGLLGAKAAPRVVSLARRVEVTPIPGALGANGGNLRVRLKPPATADTPPRVPVGGRDPKYGNIPREHQARYDRYLNGPSAKKLPPDQWYAAAQRVWANNSRGNGFEQSVRADLGAPLGAGSKPTSIEGFVPDLPVGPKYGVTDVKNVVDLSNSPQLRAFHRYAVENNLPFNSIIGPRTQTISEPLLNNIRQTGGRVMRYDPVTRQFTTIDIGTSGPWKKP
ncbi:PAAR domain-containing protein [Massilia sp. PAMC28688]|uniref:PAAR domain-containing protein n=1 Tax=Massilia sp. PAMC28688 TaxID=2861283 RepID=UPI001C630D8E|nr:PAAR domain-containing protein [Massilia sp. PAMC28688]QYF93485.1 PAAR domain-containing protein [Massilia sp. PAMC28688]